MLQPFVGRGWIPCRVIQYPKYSISNLAKCVFICDFELAMPIHFCCGFYSESVRTCVSFFVCLHTNSGLSSPTKFAVLSVHLLSPASLSHERTFSRHSRCFLNGEHDVTCKSLMYAWTSLNPKRAQTCALERYWDYYKDPLEDVDIRTCPKG